MIKIVHNLKNISQRAVYFITGSKKAGMNVLRTMVGAMRDRLNVPGDPITYPVNWDSPKQRVAFFATNGFGKGIPYKRTGNTKWTIINEFSNDEIGLFAPHPAGAVFGMPTMNFWQSRIHRGRWIELKRVLTEETAKLPERLRNALKIVFEK